MNTAYLEQLRKLNHEQGRDKAMRNSLLREWQRAYDRRQYIRASDAGWYPFPLPWNQESYHRCELIMANIKAALKEVTERMSKRRDAITDCLALHKLEKG